MTAGLNLVGKVYDYRYDLGEKDDETGGANPSGTVLQDNLSLRIASMKPTPALLEQGVESIDLFTGVIANYTVDIQNNHEIEITAPLNSAYYGKFYRILGDPQRTSTHPSDSRGFLLVTLRRVERSRAIQ